MRILTVALLLTLAGCGLVPAEPDGTTPGSRAPATTAARPADVVTSSLDDVERFWKATFPKLAGGKAFVAVRGGFHPYTKRQPPPDCGDQQGVYQPNAFYCPDGDFIAWDAQELIPQLQETYGPLLVGVVMAHEYGHAVQARLGAGDEPTVVLEQQADCFAGAWLADVQAGHSTAFKKVTTGQLDNTVAGLLMLRDQPGTPAVAEGAHGNAFDRIRALQEGVEDGAAHCAGYRADNLPVTEVPFRDRKDAASGGNLGYADAVNLLADDAQTYWAQTFPQLTGRQWTRLRVVAFDTGSAPACARPDEMAGGSAFYCPGGDFAAFDNERLAPALYQRIGDNAVGMLLGELFARAAQDRRGAGGDQLTVDCLAGSWTNNMLPRSDERQGVTLSPGDLDEAVAALLAFGRATESTGATAFDRIAAYRKGVLSGLRACV
jgi:predicted metalloprotease